MKDTLNFVGDGDDVDVIYDVERTFGIKLADTEAMGIEGEITCQIPISILEQIEHAKSTA
jgi:acyl carrier protein